MRRILLGTIGIILVLLAACTPAAAPTSAPAAPTTPPAAPAEPTTPPAAPAEPAQPPAEPAAKMDLKGWKIAVLLPGPINDAGFSAAGYAGVEALKNDYGADTAYSDRVQPVDAEAVMSEYAKNGYQVVMANGYEFDDALVAVAPKFPDVKFVQIDGAMVNDTNLYSFGYHTGEGGYLLGLIAANMTKSKKIGVIGGAQDPTMMWEFQESKAAIKSVLPDAEIMEAFVGSWEDPAKCKEIAQAQIEAGVDQLIVVTDAGDIGAVEAAQAAYDAGNTAIRVLSWGQDKWELAPKLLISGWATSNKDLEIKAMEVITANKPAAHYVFGLQDGVVGLHPFHGLVTPEVEQKINQAIEDYKSGKLKININDNL